MPIAGPRDSSLRAATRSRWATAGPLAVLPAAAVGAIYVAGHDPRHDGVYLECPFYALTGRWCPGCGLTRATYHLVTGDPIAALGANLFIPVVVAAVAVAWWAWWRRTRRRPVPRWPSRIPVGGWLGLIAAFVIFGVLRNVPGFVVLAP